MRALLRETDRLGSFRLVQELGAGAMGTVYLGEEEGRQVALKVIHPHLMRRHGFFKRFQREADLGARVDHPNVVRTLDCDLMVVEDMPCCYLVMEYVEGRTLRELLEDLGSVPETLVREIARQVAAGLQAIHAAGLVHRDLKPENVLITNDHHVRIMDLGIAKDQDASAAITREGQFAGSLLYAAPEQIRHDDVGPAADLYALGVTLYELATGRNPFRRDAIPAVMHAHLEETVPSTRSISPDLSAFFDEVVGTLLAKESESRFETAARLGEVLEEGEASAWWGTRERARRTALPELPTIQVRRETKLYGRETNLALLRSSWAKAQEGEGIAVLLEGEAGIGKTRLVDAFLRGLDGEAGHVLYGSYPPSGGGRGLSDAVLEHLGRDGLADALAPYLEEMRALTPSFASLLKREGYPAGAVVLEADAVHTAFVSLMRAMSREKPVIWVIEDLHFASADSRRVVISLARAVAGHSILLVVTTRPGLPEEEQAHLGRIEECRRVALGRLSPREVVELLEDAFQSEALAEKLGVKVARKSDGVPYFIFEMIRGLKDGQFITQLPDGSYVESKVIDDIEVPSAVQDLIEVRLKDLTQEQRSTLDVGAVQGFSFDAEVVAHVRGRAHIEVLEALAHIDRRWGVVRESGGRYRFDHHQIQEVVYAGIPGILREEYHTLLAEAIEGTLGGPPHGEMRYVLARHHLHGRQPVLGCTHLVPVLDHLASAYRHEEAVELAECALQRPGLLERADRLTVLLKLEKPLDLLARRERQLAVIDEAEEIAATECPDRVRVIRQRRAEYLKKIVRLEEALSVHEACLAEVRASGDRKAEAEAEIFVGDLCMRLGRNERAKSLFEHAQVILAERGERREELRARVGRGMAMGNLGLFDEAQKVNEHSLRLARAAEEPLCIRNALHALAISARRVGRLSDAETHGRQEMELCREAGDRDSLAAATINLGGTLLEMGRYEEARRCAERGMIIARECGNAEWEANAASILSFVYLQLGQYTEAEWPSRRSLELAARVGSPVVEAKALEGLATVLFFLGRHTEGQDVLRRATAIAREAGVRDTEATTAGTLGFSLTVTGHYGEALACFQRCLQLAEDMNHRLLHGKALTGLSQCLRKLGNFEAAQELSDRADAVNAETGSKFSESFAARQRGWLSLQEDRAQEAEESFRDALEGGERVKSPHDVAESSFGLGVALASAGRNEEARSYLTRAAESEVCAADPSFRVMVRSALVQHLEEDVEGLIRELRDQEQVLGAETRLQARFALWVATNDRSHLIEARRLLDHFVDHAPEEYRTSMLENVRLNREVMEAWAEHGEASTA